MKNKKYHNDRTVLIYNRKNTERCKSDTLNTQINYHAKYRQFQKNVGGGVGKLF